MRFHPVLTEVGVILEGGIRGSGSAGGLLGGCGTRWGAFRGTSWGLRGGGDDEEVCFPNMWGGGWWVFEGWGSGGTIEFCLGVWGSGSLICVVCEGAFLRGFGVVLWKKQ